jgi:septal ring-binding cell division protein DamX
VPVSYSPVSANRQAPVISSTPNSGLDRSAPADSTSITAASVSKKMPSEMLVPPGGIRSTVSAMAAQAAPSMVSAVAAPLSRARNAKTPARAWNGATNASTITISALPCAGGTHFSSSAVSRMVPVPKARKPSGRLLATGRSTILVIASGVGSPRGRARPGPAAGPGSAPWRVVTRP